MKFKTCLFCFSLLLLSGLVSAAGKDQPDLEKKVTELLSKMTLEEKIGQMTQVAIDVVSVPNQPVGGYHKLDPQKLRAAILTYHVGSILNVMGAAYTVENWHEIISQIQDVATKESRLGIPILYGIDSIHGANYVQDATIFPQNLGMAATWNEDLMKTNGEITAYETRAAGIPWNFNPVLDIGRQPLWPRLFETFGEDPYLASAMGAAYVKGQEGDDNDISRADKVAACMKHYIGYSLPSTGKDRTPAYIPERLLWEVCVPSFKAAIDAGVHTVMINSSEINGIPVHSSRYYLTELLRHELGFKGLVVSDWQDIMNLYTREKIANSHKEAVKMSVMAGIDMSMVPLDFSFYDHLLALAKEGSVPIARIDEAVSRILKVKFELGLFEKPYPNKRLQEKFANDDFRRAALQAAQESITLLKNEGGLLPLAKGKRILVTGPTANRLSVLNGGWTITWQGNDEKLYPKSKLTILQALQQKFGKENVAYVEGATVTDDVNIAEAAAAAKNADVAIVCLGEEAYCETPGNITDLTLNEAQLKLVEAIHAAGAPVVLVLAQGRPRIINRIVDDAEAILLAYLPGHEGGPAIADIIAGDVNPSGKLPITYPRFVNDFTLYDHKNSENDDYHKNYHPQFPFGFGLSYTTFAYSNLVLNPDTLSNDEELQVQVTVSNSGQRAGKEVVQLYLSDLVASVTPANKRLKRFEKIELAPDESKTVAFTLNESDLTFIGRDNRPVAESGEFKVAIGGLSQQFVFVQKNAADSGYSSNGR
jgi:beta-glucosidase